MPGFAITGLVCDTPNYGAGGDTIFVTLNSGEDVTCTFTNTELGSITVAKHAVADTPADQGQDFTFFTSLGNFALDDDTDPTLSNTQTFGDLLPGLYNVGENIGLPGWSLTGLTCGLGATVDLNTGVATIDLVVGRGCDVHVHQHAEPSVVDDREGHAPQQRAGLRLHHDR